MSSSEAHNASVVRPVSSADDTVHLRLDNGETVRYYPGTNVTFGDGAQVVSNVTTGVQTALSAEASIQSSAREVIFQWPSEKWGENSPETVADQQLAILKGMLLGHGLREVNSYGMGVFVAMFETEQAAILAIDHLYRSLPTQLFDAKSGMTIKRMFSVSWWTYESRFSKDGTSWTDQFALRLQQMAKNSGMWIKNNRVIKGKTDTDDGIAGISHTCLSTDSEKVVQIGRFIKSEYAAHINAQLQDATPAQDKIDDPNSDLLCPICTCPAEDAKLMSCGHAYCADCFLRFCTNPGQWTERADIDCCAFMGPRAPECGARFSLEEIKRMVEPLEFEKILRLSFESYTRANSQLIRPCPKPGCQQSYKPAPANNTAAPWSCPECFGITCAACGAEHMEGPCDAFIDEELQKHKEEQGLKDCPGCHSTIDKYEGCNHVTCGSCGIHICWVCLETFAEGGQCYQHLYDVHGGHGGPVFEINDEVIRENEMAEQQLRGEEGA